MALCNAYEITVRFLRIYGFTYGIYALCLRSVDGAFSESALAGSLVRYVITGCSGFKHGAVGLEQNLFVRSRPRCGVSDECCGILLGSCSA